jgi:diamine N-acetyltransferase
MFESEKILLRPCEPSDLEVMYQWENNQSNWLLSDTIKPFSKYTLEEFLKQDQSDIYAAKQQRFIIQLKNPDKTIGLIDLYNFDPHHHRAGVGVLIGDLQERKKNYASDALQLLHQYSFGILNLNQLFCYIQVSNAASIRLFEKAGYKKTGTLKKWLMNNGKYENVFFYQCL